MYLNFFKTNDYYFTIIDKQTATSTILLPSNVRNKCVFIINNDKNIIISNNKQSLTLYGLDIISSQSSQMIYGSAPFTECPTCYNNYIDQLDVYITSFVTSNKNTTNNIFSNTSNCIFYCHHLGTKRSFVPRCSYL